MSIAGMSEELPIRRRRASAGRQASRHAMPAVDVAAEGAAPYRAVPRRLKAAC